MQEAEPTFEETMKNLEMITQELEKGDLNLDEAVAKFEEGMALSKKCNAILESASKRITVLVEKEDKLEEENFIHKED